MVEQRPFKALVPGSSPGQPILSWLFESSPEILRGWLRLQVPPNPLSIMAWVYILRGESGRHYIGSTDDLQRRLAEHRRGSNHTTRRLGGEIELVAEREVATSAKARALEMKLKRKKNPQIAIFVLQSSTSI